ncbi:unannotated protein [freshwater metagenome]|uniref:Unannotated protein n=1 Tax=freshwater metagenome TaxID=449393 RepID=A0A6J7EU77_9ZZZZ|nr:glycosyltransferase [Actinomycetota bacterium]
MTTRPQLTSDATDGSRYPRDTMLPPPVITFAIPYHRNIDYLLEAVASVRAQTISNWELVIVDDCGPDDASVIIAGLGDNRIRYLRNEANLGLASNWNECLRQSTTALVTLLHSDDRLLPGYGAAVLSAAGRHPDTAAFFTDASIIGSDGAPARSLPDFVKRFAHRPRRDHQVAGDTDLASVLANNYIFCPTLCYRASLVGTAPFDPRWSFVVDLDHVTRLLLAGRQLWGIRSPLYEYRRHASNQTSLLTADATRFAEEIALYREVATAAKATGWRHSARAARHRTMVRMHLVLQVANDALHARFTPAREKQLMLWNDLRGDRQHDRPRGRSV